LIGALIRKISDHWSPPLANASCQWHPTTLLGRAPATTRRHASISRLIRNG
jgi:hypothetical protein